MPWECRSPRSILPQYWGHVYWGLSSSSPQEDRACVYVVSFWVPSSHMAHSLCSEGVAECSCCSVAKLCPTLCDSMNCSTPGLPVHHLLPEFTETHVHWVSDSIQPSHPLLPSSPLALNLSQHQGLFHWVQWVECMHEQHVCPQRKTQQNSSLGPQP